MTSRPKQIISVAAGMIPFLTTPTTQPSLKMGSKHGTAGSAAAPERRPRCPAPGWRTVARDSKDRAALPSEAGMSPVDARRTSSPATGELPRISTAVRRVDPKGGVPSTSCANFMRSKRRHVLQSEAHRSGGPEGQIGRRHRAALPPTMARWRSGATCSSPHAVEWPQLEDAILISEKALEGRIFTSIHIREFE